MHEIPWTVAVMVAPFVTLLLLGLAVVVRPPAARGVAEVVSAFALLFAATRRDRHDSLKDSTNQTE